MEGGLLVVEEAQYGEWGDDTEKGWCGRVEEGIGDSSIFDVALEKKLINFI